MSCGQIVNSCIFHSSICIFSWANNAARLDSNSDSLRPGSSPCFAFGESENKRKIAGVCVVVVVVVGLGVVVALNSI